MPDMEKVITGLELCTNISPGGCLMLCPYKDEKDETYSGFCEQVLKHDALDLLKEHDIDVKEASKNINNQDPIVALRAAIVCTNLHDEYSVGFRNGIRYAISLLTGKEPKYEDVT